MNKKYAAIGLALFAFAGIWTVFPPAEAFTHHVFNGFEKTGIIAYVDVQPASGDNASYYLVYLEQLSTGEITIIELQNNSVSMVGNIGGLLGGEINLDYLLLEVRQNVGNTVTFECNGLDEKAIEEYPNCNVMKNIKGDSHLPVNSIVELETYRMLKTLTK